MRCFLAISTNCDGAGLRPLSPRSLQKWVSHVYSPAQTISRQKLISPVKPFSLFMRFYFYDINSIYQFILPAQKRAEKPNDEAIVTGE
jgi:hypothetical protein